MNTELNTISALKVLVDDRYKQIALVRINGDTQLTHYDKKLEHVTVVRLNFLESALLRDALIQDLKDCKLTCPRCGHTGEDVVIEWVHIGGCNNDQPVIRCADENACLNRLASRGMVKAHA